MIGARFRLLFQALTLNLLLLGCASSITKTDGKYDNYIYSNTLWSLETIFDTRGAHDYSPLCLAEAVGIIVLPFGLAVDTVALPYTIPHYVFENFEEDPQVRVYNEVAEGDLEEVREDLAEGAEVNHVYGKSEALFSTLLCRAIASQDPDTVSFLIDAGSDVNQSCETGLRYGVYSPLEIAARYGGHERRQIIEILKSRGAKQPD